jgi:hypothetical protein
VDSVGYELPHLVWGAASRNGIAKPHERSWPKAER